MRPLVISGGPAVGKSTCGRILAGDRERAAFLDVDDIRQLVVAGAEPPWRGAEGAAQHRLAVRNVGALVRNFGTVGVDTVVADVVTPEVLASYRSEVPGCLIVHLALPLAEACERAATRPVYLTDAEFGLLHEAVAPPPAVDVVLDVSGLTLGEQTDAIRSAWLTTMIDSPIEREGRP